MVGSYTRSECGRPAASGMRQIRTKSHRKVRSDFSVSTLYFLADFATKYGERQSKKSELTERSPNWALTTSLVVYKFLTFPVPL